MIELGLGLVVVASVALGYLLGTSRARPARCTHAAIDLAALIPPESRSAWLDALCRRWGIGGFLGKEVREKAAAQGRAAKVRAGWN